MMTVVTKFEPGNECAKDVTKSIKQRYCERIDGATSAAAPGKKAKNKERNISPRITSIT